MLTDRDHLPELFIKDFIISIFAIATYAILLTLIAKTNDIYIYPFLRLSIPQIIFFQTVLCLISFNVYQLYNHIVEKKHKKRLLVETNGKLLQD